MSYGPGGGGAGTHSDRVGELTTLMIELEEEIQAEQKKYRESLANVDAICQNEELIPVEIQRSVMTLRYLNGLSFDEIADKLYFSKRHVTRLHGWALDSLERNKDKLIKL